METLMLSKVVSLAIVDAINPCALAVLALMLMAIMSLNKDRKKVLFSGLSFSFAVFIGYILYGLILVKFFSLIQAITSARVVLYKILGWAALLIGILQLKDSIWYKPGGIATEMPLKWRPKAKKLISKATGPKSAFFVGIFVTVFLLPCTMGPYVVMAGAVSFYKFMEAIAWLLLYNAIFISPMVAITLIVYLGLKNIKDIKKWRDEKIRLIHFVESAILILIGAGMIFGFL